MNTESYNYKIWVLRGSFLAVALTCLFWPGISSGVALGLGLFFGIALTNPFTEQTKSLTHKFLSLAVVGLGAGMNLHVVAKVGLQGFSYTLIGISVAIGLGLFLGSRLKVFPDTSVLISVGTAICGGSAIASVSPVLKAKAHEISVALGIVFLLNSIALFVFPKIGLFFHMSQEQFGLWSALAIHDTSSVVGATLTYGQKALEVGTTVKLARALWIVPVTIAVGYFVSKRKDVSSQSDAKRKYPWFILGFLITAALYTWIPALGSICAYLDAGAKRLMVLTLFLIGSNLNKSILKTMGFRPLAQGITLWLVMASLTLVGILQNWIHL